MRNEAVLTKGVDWVLIWMYIILVSIGVLCIFSVEYHNNEDIIQNILALKKNYSRQLLFIGMSAVVAVFILLTDSKFFTATANISYVLGIFLMLAIGAAEVAPKPAFSQITAMAMRGFSLGANAAKNACDFCLTPL